MTNYNFVLDLQVLITYVIWNKLFTQSDEVSLHCLPVYPALFYLHKLYLAVKGHRTFWDSNQLINLCSTWVFTAKYNYVLLENIKVKWHLKLIAALVAYMVVLPIFLNKCLEINCWIKELQIILLLFIHFEFVLFHQNSAVWVLKRGEHVLATNASFLSHSFHCS